MSETLQTLTKFFEKWRPATKRMAHKGTWVKVQHEPLISLAEHKQYKIEGQKLGISTMLKSKNSSKN